VGENQQDGLGSVEARHLGESLNLIREDIKDLRNDFKQELRDGLASRPTHSDLGALDKILSERMKQDREFFDARMEALKKELSDIKKDEDQIEDEEPDWLSEESKNRVRRRPDYQQVESTCSACE
jgi:hypothetical protein